MESLLEEEVSVGLPSRPPVWQVYYVCGVLLYMFVALLSDRVGADMVMSSALALLLAAGIVTTEEALEGFANGGLLTVLVMFVVAAGIGHTGALDWYMGKWLGRPQSTAGAQLRLMIPVGVISAFLNNTPVVAVMIPILSRWGSNHGIHPRLLLIPLSFCSILGGTCTLIGTSTNLVVAGLLEARYPHPQAQAQGGGESGVPVVDPIGLLDLGVYGVPVALVGLTYVLVATPCLLRAGNSSTTGVPTSMVDGEELLLGARLTRWSGAAGRSVKRSGLRDTGGMYLVSVHRAATGNVHRAVGQDFVLNVGDVLYFTGAGSLVETFGEFCQEQGLELVTNEVQDGAGGTTGVGKINGNTNANDEDMDMDSIDVEAAMEVAPLKALTCDSNVGVEVSATTTTTTTILLPMIPEIAADLGTTAESLRDSDDAERLRSIRRIEDAIRGTDNRELEGTSPNGAPKIVVVTEDDRATVAINTRDRPGLLHDISRTLAQRLGLNLHRTEATVSGGRSLSLWRCEIMKNDDHHQDHHHHHDHYEDHSVHGDNNNDNDDDFLERIWLILHAVLESQSEIEATKHRGLRVIRATVTKNSSLVGKTAAETDFRQTYGAAIVAVHSPHSNHATNHHSTEGHGHAHGHRQGHLAQVRLHAGDVLVLQAEPTSPLLERPPDGFYDHPSFGTSSQSAPSSVFKFMRKKISSIGSFGSIQGSHSDRSDSVQSTTATTTDHNDADVNNPEGLVAVIPPMVPLSVPMGTTDANADDDGPLIMETEDNTFLDDDDDDNNDDDDMKNDNDNVVQDELAFEHKDRAWRDLKVFFVPKDDNDAEASSPHLNTREFLTAMEVKPRSNLIHKSATASGLDKLAGVFLVTIERPLPLSSSPAVATAKRNTSRDVDTLSDADTGNTANHSQANQPRTELLTRPLSREEALEGGDVLWFSGTAAAVGDLRKIPGLRLYVNDEVKKINERVHDRRLVQAVIARKGSLVGRTVRDVRFRTKFGAAVIAVHREGRRIQQHPGTVRLQAGDVLLLEAGPTFVRRNAESDTSFSLLSEVEDSAPPRLRLLIPAIVLAVAMLAVYTAGVTSLLVCSLVASMLMVASGILSQQEVRDAVNWEVYVTIACAFGIGTALTNSGVAGAVATGLVRVGGAVRLPAVDHVGLYAAVYLATFLISNVVTNNAAAALLFPIAMDAAEATGADLQRMSYILMLGASASFMSPFGYTTNLLIYGPGGYQYADFLRFGTPLQVVLWIVSVAIVATADHARWYLTWTVSLALFVGVSFGMTWGPRHCHSLAGLLKTR